MKLKKLTKHIDFMQKVRLVSFCKDAEEEELYFGIPMNIPYSLMKWELDTDEDGEAIYLSDRTIPGQKSEAIMNIYIKEK